MDRFTENMTPQKLIEIILSNTNYLVDLYENEGGIRDKRMTLKLKQAEMYDKEQEAREEIFGGKVQIQASRQRDWLKWKTLKPTKEYEMAKHDLYDAMEQKEILIEIIQTAKIALRVMEMEAKSLHLNT